VTAEAITVLASPADSSIEANPYIHLLYRAVQGSAAVTAHEWSPRRAWRRRWDLAHFHWPELTVSFRTPRRARDIATFLATVAWLRLRGTRVVWTAHDLRPHDSADNRWAQRFYAAFARQADLVIALSQASADELHSLYPGLRGTPTAVVPHGHYRDVYPDRHEGKRDARQALGLPDGGRLLTFLGQVRPYKGVATLVRHFVAVAGPDDHLLIAGRPHQDWLGQEIEAAAAGQPNVHLRLGHVPAGDIDRVVRASDVIVLPYESILNSGSALLGLSFDRPVVVPAVGSLRELADQVGREWVRTYEGPFTGEVVRAALREPLPEGQPDLAAFDWSGIGQATVAAYRSVLPLSTSHRRMQ
jgi:beta-1,4-mannosyltransferase